jgi:GxxExxY protein
MREARQKNNLCDLCEQSLRSLRETKNMKTKKYENKKMTENEIATKIIGCAIELHRNLGAGLLESCYEAALAFDLAQQGFDVKTQVSMPFVYKGVKQDVGYRIDLLVDNKVLIEIKSVENLAPVHYAQTLTYLKLSGIKLGLLINFNTKILKDGIHRIVNNL